MFHVESLDLVHRLCVTLQLSSVKSQLEEEKIRLEKMHSDEMEKLLQKVT